MFAEIFRRDSVKLSFGVIGAAVILALAFTSGSPGQQRPQFGAEPPGQTTDASGAEESSSPLRIGGSTIEAAKTNPKPRSAAAPNGSTAAEPKTPSGGSTAPTRPNAQQPATPTPEKRAAPRRAAPRQPTRSPAASQPDLPAPSAGLSAARVRALPGDASMEQATATLGLTTSASAMRSRYGAGPVRELLRAEPEGMICRYYGLAATEPAPFVRICFDVNGVMRTREFVAPKA